MRWNVTLKENKRVMPLIIPIFIKNRGCPHRCIFCHERMVAGDHPDEITEVSVRSAVEQYLSGATKKRGEIQIAFYGGNFTGLDEQEQSRLLGLTEPYLEDGRVHSLRISARPDAIDSRILDRLRAYRVRTVEIGAQSMNDEVLRLSERGHTAREVVKAVHLSQEKELETGIHLMAGLPGDNPERFSETLEAVIAMKPAMVRLHPTIVFQGTVLGKLYRTGGYRPLGMDEAVSLCKSAVRKLTAHGIPIIRLGLQTTKEMETPGNILAGPYHPAFGALVYESLFCDMAKALLTHRPYPERRVAFRVSPADASHLRGRGQYNLKTLKEAFGLTEIIVTPDESLQRGILAIQEAAPDAPQLTTSLSDLV